MDNDCAGTSVGPEGTKARLGRVSEGLHRQKNADWMLEVSPLMMEASGTP